jgi:hypothetical protein
MLTGFRKEIHILITHSNSIAMEKHVYYAFSQNLHLLFAKKKNVQSHLNSTAKGTEKVAPIIL